MVNLKHFLGDKRGNVSQMFAISLFPLLSLSGAAIDYSRAEDARAQLQMAVDAASLKLARDGRNMTDAELGAAARRFVEANFHSPQSTGAVAITVSRTAEKIKVSGTAAMPTAFVSIFGFNTLPVVSASESAFGRKKIELVLVLDNTGSMGRLNKMTELKRAVNTLVADFEAMRPVGDEIKVSIVPFDTQVRVDANLHRAATWLTYAPAGPTPFDTRTTQAAWGGCLIERGPFAADNNDVSERLPNPVLPETLHPAVGCKADLARIRPLTNSWGDLRSTVAAMAPGGCTDITIGARWGLEMLSNSQPFGEGKAYGTSDTEKYMVLLTDGDNTQNRWVNGCGGAGSTALIDQRTRKMCDEITERGVVSKQRNIQLFTIRVIDGNRNLLRDCASKPEMYSEVNDASQLTSVFRGIFEAVTKVRVTS